MNKSNTLFKSYSKIDYDEENIPANSFFIDNSDLPFDNKYSEIKKIEDISNENILQPSNKCFNNS